MPTTLIRGGTVVNADLSERVDVLIGDGKIIVSDLNNVVRIRNGETGESAI